MGSDDIDAGRLAPWAAAAQAAIRHEGDADVPCGGCTACCTASQFVHVAPDEHDALAHIPAALLFPAPGAPPGHRLMGYDERGRCPMLGEHSCTIYEHRPRTCRTYDCRVFAATGVDADDGTGTKVEIARRARRWRFDVVSESDRAVDAALREAAAAVAAHPDAPADPVGRAVLAVAVHDACIVEPASEVVSAALRRRTPG